MARVLHYILSTATATKWSKQGNKLTIVGAFFARQRYKKKRTAKFNPTAGDGLKTNNVGLGEKLVGIQLGLEQSGYLKYSEAAFFKRLNCLPTIEEHIMETRTIWECHTDDNDDNNNYPTWNKLEEKMIFDFRSKFGEEVPVLTVDEIVELLSC